MTVVAVLTPGEVGLFEVEDDRVEDVVTDDLEARLTDGDVGVICVLLDLRRRGDGEAAVEDEALLLVLSSSSEPSLSRLLDSSLDLQDSNRSRSSSPLIKNE